MCHWRLCAEKGQHRDSMVISRWKCKCLFCAQTRSSAASLSQCISNTCNLSIYIYTVRSIFKEQESWPVLRNSFSVWTIGRYIICFSSISNFTLGNHTWHNFSFSFGDSDSMIEIVWKQNLQNSISHHVLLLGERLHHQMLTAVAPRPFPMYNHW